MCTCVEKLHILLSFSMVMSTIKVKSVTEIFTSNSGIFKMSSMCH